MNSIRSQYCAGAEQPGAATARKGKYMGGFFGAASKNDCISDVFFGTDYHSHLGTRRGGMTAYSPELGFQRNIHSIENSPFRTKFEIGRAHV